MLSAVQLDSYSMHDLDPEWRVLLESLDARLRASWVAREVACQIQMP